MSIPALVTPFVNVSLGAGLFVAAFAVHAAVLTFENGGGTEQFVLDHVAPYQPNPFDAPPNGADNLVQQTASEWAAINPEGFSLANLYWDGGAGGGANTPLNLLLDDTFDLNRLWVAGVYGSQTLTLKGYNNGAQLYQSSLFIDLTPRLFVANWTGIDQLQLLTGNDVTPDPDFPGLTSYAYWAIDNVQYNQPVPVPAALWLFGSALLGLPLLARKPAPIPAPARRRDSRPAPGRSRPGCS